MQGWQRPLCRCPRRPGSKPRVGKIAREVVQHRSPGPAILPTLRTASCVRTRPALFLLEKARKLLLETRQPAAAIEQLLLAAGPGRMRLRIDVEVHRVARFAPGGPGGEL